MIGKRIINAGENVLVPSEHFSTDLYTGTGSAITVSGMSFQPDLVWVKSRSNTWSHLLMNSVTDGTLTSNSTAAEVAQPSFVFNSDGFTTPTGGSWTNNGDTYVGWSWKAGGVASSNTDGTITSSVSANTRAGFSVVSYTGNGAASGSIGHGLSQAPKMMIFKNKGGVTNWFVWHNDGTTLRRLEGLNTTAAAVTSGLITSFDADTFNFSTTTTDFNGSGSNYIAYCFAEVEGFSKIGSFTGQAGDTSGYINCGFAPIDRDWETNLFYNPSTSAKQ